MTAAAVPSFLVWVASGVGLIIVAALSVVLGAFFAALVVTMIDTVADGSKLWATGILPSRWGGIR